MIVDSSALIAVLLDEPERDTFLQAMSDEPTKISAANLLEAGLVADGRSAALGHALDSLVEALEMEVVPVTRRHAERARAAHRRYGRGSGSPARLNFGDCLAYALAADEGETLLFKGADFIHTDVLAPDLNQGR